MGWNKGIGKTGRQERRRNYHSKKGLKDIDQCYDDVKEENIKKFDNLPIDHDLIGQGQFYCVQCSRYFITQTNLEFHRRTKSHKKRVKLLKEKPYDHEEAERGAGRAPPTKGK